MLLIFLEVPTLKRIMWRRNWKWFPTPLLRQHPGGIFHPTCWSHSSIWNSSHWKNCNHIQSNEQHKIVAFLEWLSLFIGNFYCKSYISDTEMMIMGVTRESKWGLCLHPGPNSFFRFILKNNIHLLVFFWQLVYFWVLPGKILPSAGKNSSDAHDDDLWRRVGSI